jgi:protoporphyrinogen oxidase
VLSTLPLPVLARTARGAVGAAVPLPELEYQGVVNAVVVMKRALGPFYWTIAVDPEFAFQGVVETTHVIPPEWLGGRHLVYLMTYCRAGSEAYERPEALLRRQAVEGLARLYPGFRPDDVEAVYAFRAPHVEPVWTLGYAKKRPPARTRHPRLYVSTTAQAYPRVTAWNTSIALAGEAMHALAVDHGARGRHQSPQLENERWLLQA